MITTSSKYETVMFIDDSEIDNLINNHLIRKSNFASKVCIHNGPGSALEYLQKVSNDNLHPELIPDIIFLDINMPIMNGFQFLDEYEKIANVIKKPIKIVILSSSVDPADLQHSKENKYIIKMIHKPLSYDALDELLEEGSPLF